MPEKAEVAVVGIDIGKNSFDCGSNTIVMLPRRRWRGPH